MGGLTFAGLLLDARAQCSSLKGNVDLPKDLPIATRLVDEWLRYIRRAITRGAVSGGHVAALAVMERSFGGVLRAMKPAEPPLSRQTRLLYSVTRALWTSEPPPEPAPTQVHLDVDALFVGLSHTAEAVDALLDDVAAMEPVRETLPWADDHELLAQLWPLLCALATNNGEAALAQLRELEQTLRLHHDVEICLADETTAEAFDLHPGSTDRYVTITPALIVRGRVWKRGEARLPEDTDVTAPGPRTTHGEGAT